MSVPLLDVNAQNLPLEAELKQAFERVLRSGQFIMGPDVAAFENEIAGMIGAKHAIGVSSGTDAILLALMTLGIGHGDEVLCPTFTFFATAGCIARTGATPIFVDADPVSFNLDVQDAARKVTRRTRAIIPVHLFGQCADMDGVLALAREHNLSVIEDAAQSLGARYKGRHSGTMGTFGTYSFFPSKNLGGLGDGGMLVTNDDGLAEKARLLRTHGARPKYCHKFIGANFRLDTVQAAFLRVKLSHYSTYTAKRKNNAARYTEMLGRLPHITLSAGRFADSKALVLPAEMPDCDHIWNQYTLRAQGADRRDSLRKHLADAGIGTEVYYPIPMHNQECFASIAANGSCPMAEKLAAEVLSIPIYAELPTAALEEVIAAIASFVEI